MVCVYHTEDEEFCHHRRDGVGGEEPWDVREWSASLPPKRRSRLIEYTKSPLTLPHEQIVERVFEVHPAPIMLRFDPKERLIQCLVSIEEFQDYDFLLDQLEAIPGNEQWRF